MVSMSKNWLNVIIGNKSLQVSNNWITSYFESHKFHLIINRPNYTQINAFHLSYQCCLIRAQFFQLHCYPIYRTDRTFANYYRFILFLYFTISVNRNKILRPEKEIKIELLPWSRLVTDPAIIIECRYKKRSCNLTSLRKILGCSSQLTG